MTEATATSYVLPLLLRATHGQTRFPLVSSLIAA